MPAILELSVMPNRNKAHTRRMGGISPFSFSWMCADSVSCWFCSLTEVGYRDRKALSNSVRNSLFSFSVLVEEERRLRSSLLWLAFIFPISSILQDVFIESAQKPVKYTQNRLKQTRLLTKNE